ncbi:ankyrin repeat-containing domain protein [Neurospora tetraspora]|uniref:Ankyrin repeat-containing domain protein n=1 Tax=Neurospora tetraspora TaxID=94610 RepID=A0AAE0JFM1_9PEZI|nr:ankyrin repeat-containing domain protein [Neurospora tetraspora]
MAVGVQEEQASFDTCSALIGSPDRFTLEAENTDGHTALGLSIIRGHLATTQMLLDQRYWSMPRSSLDKALLLAASTLEEQKSCGICSALIKYGAKLDEMNVEGDTALHVAAYRGHVATVKLLLDKHPKRGREPHVENKKGATPSSLACHYGHLTTLVALDEHHSHYHAPFALKECHKLMEIASFNHHDEIVKYLFKKYPYLHLSRILLDRIPQAESKSETRSEEFLKVLSSTENLRIGAEILELVIRSREFRHLFKELLKSPKLQTSTFDWYCLVSKIKGDALLLADLDEETKDAIEGFKQTSHLFSIGDLGLLGNEPSTPSSPSWSDTLPAPRP